MISKTNRRGHQWLVSLGSETYQLRREATFTFAGGEMVSFNIQLLVKIDDVWEEIRRYDTAHGQPHVHVFQRSGKEEIRHLEGFGIKSIFDNSMGETMEENEKWLKQYLIGQ